MNSKPENHLSHTNVGKLVGKISEAHTKQLIVSTHSNTISTRLNLRKTILMNSGGDKPIKLDVLETTTAKFFMKAPDNNILDFILSTKVLLVEGDAEFMLMEAFYKNTTGKNIQESGVHVLSVGGLSFKRYMEIAVRLNIKTAIVRDNDGNYQKNIIDNYTGYPNAHIQLFSDKDNSRSTFELCLYEDNKKLCDTLFAAGRVSLTVQEYMLQNKSEVAFQIADQQGASVITPQYIKEAIEWISA